MRIIHEQPDQRCDLSLAPIDVGFDPRVHDMICILPATARLVGYKAGGEARMVEGSTEEIIAELHSAGYIVRVEG